MAVLMSAVTNGGTIYKPQLVEKVMDISGRVVKRFNPEARGSIKIPSAHLEAIKKALRGVVIDPHGTGKNARVKGLEIMGKTGTAQVVKQKKRGQEKKLAFKQKDHAWFIASAQAGGSKLAITVIVEHGGHGGDAAAPIAKQIFETWMKLQLPAEQILEREA
jgi:penicillin-binding protein 2